MNAHLSRTDSEHQDGKGQDASKQRKAGAFRAGVLFGLVSEGKPRGRMCAPHSIRSLRYQDQKSRAMA